MINVLERIRRTVEKHGERPALEIGDEQWSYQQLWNAAEQVVRAIRRSGCTVDTPVTLFTARRMETYASLLGAVLAGHPYLPVNIRFPAGRVARSVDLARSSIFVVSSDFLPLYREFAVGYDGNAHIIVFDSDVASQVSRDIEQKIDVLDFSQGLEREDPLLLPEEFSRFVYILFTSGTTGEPKGIPISHGNLNAYLDHILDHYDIRSDDRCSQAFDITFDPSVHDIFVTWSAGACLCPLSQSDLLLPNRFITERHLTVWYSVPSIALRMKQVRMLKSGAFPRLRYSIFAGEALPMTVASAWQKAAPNARVINMYGPTEATIIISAHEWDELRSPSFAANGIVPIGSPFPSFSYTIRNQKGNQCEIGEEGELFVSGPQVCEGYLNDPLRTADSFVRLPGKSNSVWYRTGDSVREAEYGVLQYLGRIDDQVKIRGYRVEPAEVARVIREYNEVIDAVVLPLSDTTGLVTGLRAWVLAESAIQMSEVIQLCKARLPDYMVPDRIVQVEAFPLKLSGKIDRDKLIGVT